ADYRHTVVPEVSKLLPHISLANLPAALCVAREPLEHLVEVPRLLARGHRGAIDLGKDPRKLREAVGEGVALHDARPHAEHDALHARLLGLLRDRQQRLLEGEAGARAEHRARRARSEETSELQSHLNLVCRLLLE